VRKSRENASTASGKINREPTSLRTLLFFVDRTEKMPTEYANVFLADADKNEAGELKAVLQAFLEVRVTSSSSRLNLNRL
jgi:hypothetical protein